MKISKKNIRKIIKRIITEDFQSHHLEPKIGSYVLNNNPGCLHYGSEGVVLRVVSLSDGIGKAIRYRVTNGGDNYGPGQILTKTMDQLTLKET